MKKPFTPEFLPISITAEDHVKLLRLTIRANEALQKLYRKIERVPVGKDLFLSFSLMESIQSTRIEGTQATFDEVLESNIKQKTSPDIIEVNNYFRAIQYGVSEIVENENPISTRMIRQLHQLVLENSRGANRAPGEFRRTQNWIGSDPNDIKTASYIPPIAVEIPNLMGNLEKFINENEDFEPLIAAGILHAQFETIHPFLDGNGRVGRLLILLYLLKKQVCGNHIIFVSEELEKSKYKYYSLLNGLRQEEPKWIDWLTFFIESIEKQAQKYLEKVNQVEGLVDKFLDDPVRKSTAGMRVLYYCFEEPITTSTKISEKSGLSITTVNTWLKYFVEKNMLYTDGKKRHVVYLFYELLDIIR